MRYTFQHFAPTVALLGTVSAPIALPAQAATRGDGIATVTVVTPMLLQLRQDGPSVLLAGDIITAALSVNASIPWTLAVRRVLSDQSIRIGSDTAPLGDAARIIARGDAGFMRVPLTFRVGIGEMRRVPLVCTVRTVAADVAGVAEVLLVLEPGTVRLASLVDAAPLAYFGPGLYPVAGTALRIATAHDTLIARMQYADADSFRVVVAYSAIAHHDAYTEMPWRVEADVPGDSVALRYGWTAIIGLDVAASESRDRIRPLLRGAVTGAAVVVATAAAAAQYHGGEPNLWSAAVTGALMGASFGAGNPTWHFTWRAIPLPRPPQRAPIIVAGVLALLTYR